jgi:hypothetical protein
MEPHVTIQWFAVWDEVGDTIADHLDHGRAHLLTEDVVRFATCSALEKHGVAASRMAFEWRIDGIGPVDLAVDAPELSAVVEFKFPRDPREKNSADTMTLGELLKDFWRLARIEATAERWAFQIVGSPLGRYLGRRPDIAWTTTVGQEFCIRRDVAALLPATAQRQLPTFAAECDVNARCEWGRTACDLTLAAYRVTTQLHSVVGKEKSSA